MIIGITGNSGAGKTYISKAIAKKINKKDVTIIDADKISKELAKPGKEYYKKIVKLFGSDILLKNKELNRNKIAQIIFSDSKKRKLLDEITFKYVVDETKNRIQKCKSKMIIVDAPLLIESKISNICDVVVSVLASYDEKIERICNRDKVELKTAELRLKSQKKDSFYINHSNYVVINNNTNIEKQAEDIIDFINSECINNENVIIQENDIKIIQFKKLLKYKELAHCYTLKPLDFGNNNNYKKNKKQIENNYKSICNFLKLDFNNMVRPHQNHTKNVIILKNEKGIYTDDLMDIDGIVTDKTNRVLSLGFADCTPLLLYDKSKKIIANVHSGWQGTKKKIIIEAVNKMKKGFKCNVEDIICIIGPTIRKCHFEVKDDVRNEFIQAFKGMCVEKEFVIKEKEKYYIDTVYLNKKMLMECGIPKKNIIDSKICTACNVKLMHSFRIEKEASGRSTALICKKE